MNLREIVCAALESWPGPAERQNCVVVPTHCIYPSNQIVSVIVSGREREFVVTDQGGALDELISGGGRTFEDLRILRDAAKSQGLSVTDNGTIYSSIVSAEQLAGTIALVANASKEAAHLLIQRGKAVPRKNFREMLARLVEIEHSRGRFLDVAEKRKVIGKSTTVHRFDYEIKLPGDKRLLLDTVMPEHSSIASVVSANFDVGQAEMRGVLQRIVYDDEDEWKAADLALLGLSATVVPFANLPSVLNRLSI